MIIKKFPGKTEEEATAKAKEELGEDVVIMNVKAIKPKGLFKAFKASSYEVTAAKEEEDPTINSAKSLMSAMRAHENVNMLADERITLPPLTSAQAMTSSESDNYSLSNKSVVTNIGEKTSGTDGLEEKLENLQSLLEKQFVPGEKMVKDELSKEQPAADERFTFIKMIYGIMLENEINEKYVNQIMDEIDKIMRNGSNVDFILSNIYQKMILKFGQPKIIEVTEKKPKVVFFIGPTGVGKTTTIAKIASKLKMDMNKKVALLTADTYRIAAAEQLRTYANILNIPLTIIYTGEELNESVQRMEEYDIIMVDTAGFSHRNEEHRNDIKNLIGVVDAKYEKEVYLVLSATTKYRDLLDIADTYKECFDFRMIFTKLDETTCYGNIFNLKMYTGADLSYSTYGQNVPDDIEVFNSQKIVKLLLGGK